MSKFLALFTQIPSLRGFINPGELVKALTIALASGGLVSLLSWLLGVIPSVVAPGYAPIAVAVVSGLLALARSFTTGQVTVPVPVPVVPASQAIFVQEPGMVEVPPTALKK